MDQSINSCVYIHNRLLHLLSTISDEVNTSNNIIKCAVSSYHAFRELDIKAIPLVDQGYLDYYYSDRNLRSLLKNIMFFKNGCEAKNISISGKVQASVFTRRKFKKNEVIQVYGKICLQTVTLN